MKRRIGLKIFCLLALMSVFLVLTLAPALTQAQPKTVRIGATTCFSTKLGIQQKKVLELLAELTNKDGGIVVKGQRYNIEYIIYDDKYDANAARAAAERLVFKDKVSFIAGIYGSAPTLALLQVTEPRKMVFFSGAATEKIYDTQYKYIFHSKALLAESFGDVMYWKENRLMPANAKTIVLASPDDPTGHGVAKDMIQAYEVAGYKVLDTIYYKLGITDFTPIATKLKSLNPDIFQAAGIMAGAPTVNLTRAVWESGWRGRMINRFGGDDVPVVVKEMGKEVIEGMIFNFKDLSDVPNPPPGFLSFKDAYMKKYGVWETEALEWCGGHYLLLAAIKKADSLDTDRIMAASKGLKTPWLIGNAQLFRRPDKGNNRYVDCAVDIPFGQIRDGKLHFVGIMPAEYSINAVEKALGMDMK